MTGSNRLEEMCEQALADYAVRVLDNIDLAALNKLPTVERAKIIAQRLMDTTDARGFVRGRMILEQINNGA